MSLQNRREFLEISAKAFSAGVLLPGLSPTSLWRSVTGDGADERIVVILEMGGGNDGLNTVVPFAQDAYYKARPTLGIPEKRVVKLDGGIGLHPELGALKELWDKGQLAVVNGVGYPHPNRSHFESMDIWHTAQPEGGARRSGWLGRHLEQRARRGQEEPPGMQIGGELGLAMRAESYQVPSLASIESLALRTDPRTGQDAALKLQTMTQLAAFERPDESAALRLARTAFTAACGEGDRLRHMAGSYQPAVRYDGGLGNRFSLIARLIDGRFPARVYYTSTGGYDTHAGQDGTHGYLHRTFAKALVDFVKDLAAHGHGQRVAIMTFSEFGRRVTENSSRGTDHGTAGPVFVAGGAVRGGLGGAYPSLTDLDSGDLKFTTDFRSLYATLLEDWLGVSSKEALGQSFPTLPLVQRRAV